VAYKRVPNVVKIKHLTTFQRLNADAHIFVTFEETDSWTGHLTEPEIRQAEPMLHRDSARKLIAPKFSSTNHSRDCKCASESSLGLASCQ